MRLSVIPFCLAFVFGVEGRGNAQPPPSSTTLSLIASIDGTEEVLSPVNGVAIGPRGMIAVVQPTDNKILLFSGSGERLDTIGRAGKGPGEFTLISRIGWIADSLWVYDGNQARISVFRPNGSIARTIRVPTSTKRSRLQGGTGEFGMITPSAMYRDGSLFAFLSSPRGANSTSFKDKNVFARVSLDGTISKLIALQPGDKNTVSVPLSGGGAAYVSFPFPVRNYVAVSSNGSRIALVDQEVEGPHKGTIGVILLGGSGDTLFSRRYPFRQEQIPKAVKDSAVDAMYTRLRRKNLSLATKFMRELKVPTIYPPVENVVLSTTGHLWIRMRDPGKSTSYMVLAPDGHEAGTVLFPGKVDLAAASGDDAWVTILDEDDVPSLRRYRVSGLR